MNLKRPFFQKKIEPYRVSHEENSATFQIAKQVTSLLPTVQTRPILVVCIGTDRSTGDALGPLVGTKLLEKGMNHFSVFGTLDEPIHALNLEEKLKEIKHQYFNPFIIGIDACLGRVKNIGSITIADGPVKPGAGVNKELPEVGDMHITGTVNAGGFMEFLVLQNTRLNIVMKMATTIADGLYKASFFSQRREDLSPFLHDEMK